MIGTLIFRNSSICARIQAIRICGHLVSRYGGVYFDEFMKRVKAEQDWYLFDPAEVGDKQTMQRRI